MLSHWKKSLLLIFSSLTILSIKRCVRTYASSRVKGRAFIEKVNSRCFCWFPAAIHRWWRLHTKLYKGAWNVSANNSETVGHKDLRLVLKLVFYNISFSWLLPLDGFQVIFLCRVYCVTVKTKNKTLPFRQTIDSGLWFGVKFPEGVVRISSDRDDRMGEKIKTKKNPLGFKQN